MKIRMTVKRGMAGWAIGFMIGLGGAASAAQPDPETPVAQEPTPQKTRTMKPAPAGPHPLAFLEPFMGTWVQHHDFRAGPGLAPDPATFVVLKLQWGIAQATLEFEQGFLDQGPLNLAGTVAWNSALGRADFLAAEKMSKSIHHGYFEPVDARTVRWIHDLIGSSGDVHSYRETFQLRPDGALIRRSEYRENGTYRLLFEPGDPGSLAVRPDTGMPAWARRHLESRIGRWIAGSGAFESEEETFVIYRQTWEWGVGEQSVVGRLIGVDPWGNQVPIREYRVVWSPADQALRYIRYDRDGSMGDGILDPAAKQSTRLVQNLCSPNGRCRLVAHLEFPSPEVRHVESFDVMEDGTWKSRRRYSLHAEEAPQGSSP